jgi:hypothetical protein
MIGISLPSLKYAQLPSPCYQGVSISFPDVYKALVTARSGVVLLYSIRQKDGMVSFVSRTSIKKAREGPFQEALRKAFGICGIPPIPFGSFRRVFQDSCFPQVYCSCFGSNITDPNGMLDFRAMRLVDITAKGIEQQVVSEE